MKSVRQEKILELIAQGEIETQHGLADALRKVGLDSTQATISRDIRELGLTKELGPSGRFRYAAPRQGVISGHSERLGTIFRESVTSVAVAQNLVVIRTLPGLANAAGAALDGMEVSSLVGTLAGDDTVFLAMTDVAAAERFQAEISKML